jgi:starch synthase
MRQAALAFSEREQLAAFYVSFDAQRNMLLKAPGPFGRLARREAARRQIMDRGLRACVREVAWPYDVAGAATARVTGRSSAMRRIVLRLFRAFDAAVARSLPSCLGLFIGHAGACLESMKAARAAGATTVVNWNVPHWSLARAEKVEEDIRNPEWADTFAFPYWIDNLEARWTEELAHADYILAPSSLVRDTFINAGYASASILTIPYGVDLERFSISRYRASSTRQPLRVLYVGEIGQRKGISYLLDVARQLPKIRFVVRGWQMGSLRTALPANVQLLPATTNIVDDFAIADVLLFPSLYDGFGLVVLEALACGLPVITSSNAGAADVVRDGVDGFVVAPRAVTAMVERLTHLDGNREALAKMSDAARSRAEEFPWQRYRASLADALMPR